MRKGLAMKISPFPLASLLYPLLLMGCGEPIETSSQADETLKTATQISSFDKTSMDNILNAAIENGDNIGLSALVFDEGKIVYQGTFGYRDREKDLPVEIDTVFRIHSMTKPVTATIIMDLQEEGLLNLEDPVTKYIPELGSMQVMSVTESGEVIFTPQENPMTLEDLMLHRSGIGYGIFGETNPIEKLYFNANLFDSSENLAIKMTKLSNLPLIAQPGQGWYYSYSMDVLGRVAEIVTGQNLDEIMQERIFDPLKMTDTGFRVRPDQENRFATLYSEEEDGSFVPITDDEFSSYAPTSVFSSGGGGLVSTIGDYAKFAHMLLDGGIHNDHRILDEATVAAMMSNQMDDDDIYMFPWLGGETNAAFGYGGSVQIATDTEQATKTGKAEGQYGWSGLARPTFWIDKPNNAFGIIMLQYLTENDPAIHDSFRALAYEQTKNSQ